MANLDTYFGAFGCGQIQAESKHDGLPKDPATYFSTIDLYQTACNGHAAAGQPDFTDDSFAQYIFNRTTSTKAKQEIKAAGLSSSHYIQYRGMTQGGLSHTLYNGNIGTFRNVMSDPQEMRNFINMFNKAKYYDVYLFIDTGHSLITAMNQQMKKSKIGQNGPDPKLHVINSQISMGDSCTVGKNLYNTNFYNKNVYCWWYRENINVHPHGHHENFMFFTSLGCSLTDAGAANWADTNISQKWYNGATLVGNIQQTMFYNNIASVSNDINAGIAQLSGHSVTSGYTAGIYHKIALCYQRKRSGDGFQIWFVNHFARILSQGNQMFFATCYDGYQQHKDASTIFLPNAGASKADIRKRSFFVTQDWPAFCWAAYCHINVIFYNSGDVILFIAASSGYNVIP